MDTPLRALKRSRLSRPFLGTPLGAVKVTRDLRPEELNAITAADREASERVLSPAPA